jgi:hypothetical protein
VDRSLLSITSKRNVERDLLLKVIRMCGITVLKGACVAGEWDAAARC